MKRLTGLISLLIVLHVLFAGGPPSKGTPKDMRKKANNPTAGKTAAQTKVTKAVTPPPKKGK